MDKTRSKKKPLTPPIPNAERDPAVLQIQENLLYLINEAATQIQRSARSEEAVFKAVEEQITALGLVGGLCTVDDVGESVVVRAYATTGPSRVALAALEAVAGLTAIGISFPIKKVDVYSELFQRGRSVFEKDNNNTVLQAVPDALRPMATKISGIFGHMPAIFAPIWNGSEVVGGLNIAGEGLTTAFIPTIEVLANHIAIALENARLYTKMKRAEKLLLERTTDLALINELSEALSGGEELDIVFQRLDLRLREIFAVASSTVLLTSRDGTQLRLRYAESAQPFVRHLEQTTGKSYRELRFPYYPTGPLASAGIADEPIDVLDREALFELITSTTDARWIKSATGKKMLAAVANLGDVALLLIPFSIEQKPVGFLACTLRQPMDGAQTIRLKNIARQLAPAISQRQGQQALSRSLRELQLLADIRRMTMDGEPFEIVLGSVGAALWQLPNIRSVALLLHDVTHYHETEPRPSIEETTIDQLADLHDVEIRRCPPGTGSGSKIIRSVTGGTSLVLTGAELGEQAALLAKDDPLAGVLTGAAQEGDLQPCAALIRLSNAEGPMGWLAMVSSAMLTTGERERMERLAGLITSIVGRLRVERERQATRTLLMTAIDCGPDALVVIDTEYQIMLANGVAREMYADKGETSGRARHCWEFFHRGIGQPCDDEDGKNRCAVKEVIDCLGTVTVLKNHTRPDGSQQVFEEVAAPLFTDNKLSGLVLMIRDITGRTALEQEMLKAHKIESLGLLAGGIAHDFNNLLTAILGNLDLAKRSLPPTEECQELLADAEQASRQAAELARRLLTFSRGNAPRKELASVAALVRESVRFPLRGTAITTSFDLPEELWAVEADSGQISQMVNNVVINAMQAMPNGGAIRVEARNREIGPGRVPGLSFGRYVEVVITDQGVGISQEHLSRIFDPYFTTKEGGSGLGLATSHTIVRKHGGQLTAESAPGSGTTIRFYLPASNEPAPPPSLDDPTFIPHGQGNILVMDDEPMVRRVANEILRRLGYSVTLAEDGEQAIDLYRDALETIDPFDAVIIDLTVPGGMGGKEAAQWLLRLDPQALLIVSTGYAVDMDPSEYKEHGFVASIPKPYDMAGMSHVLRDVLTGSDRNDE